MQNCLSHSVIVGKPEANASPSTPATLAAPLLPRAAQELLSRPPQQIIECRVSRLKHGLAQEFAQAGRDSLCPAQLPQLEGEAIALENQVHPFAKGRSS